MQVALLVALLVLLSACRPPGAAHALNGALGERQSARLPEPGVYVLRLARGLPLPADLKPHGAYRFFERVLAGWLYLTPARDYQTIICADLVDSAGRVPPDASDGGLGGKGNKYWVSGGRIYFSDVIADGPVDSTAVRVHGDTVEFVRNLFVRDRASVQPRSLIPAFICAPVRASVVPR